MSRDHRVEPENPCVISGAGITSWDAKSEAMLLRNRPPMIESVPASTAVEGYEHVTPSSLSVMKWLTASGVDYVLVGQVARAIRGDAAARGPVAIVPAPYGRNLDRLARALNAAHASERSHGQLLGVTGQSLREQTLKLNASMLVRPQRWALRCGDHELDVEGRPAGSPSYQELLYEAVRYELAPQLAVEVAAPEDIEQYEHVRRTGVVPEMVVTRA